ncbi:hypothetical protein WJX74_004883 [Apatococcus lobatus]|uniref:Uncharacterized protein n=1 Tax=Apatococcus lobatus TaxID=904363 RepID=A0AAW1RYW4_9CHLO
MCKSPSSSSPPSPIGPESPIPSDSPLPTGTSAKRDRPPSMGSPGTSGFGTSTEGRSSSTKKSAFTKGFKSAAALLEKAFKRTTGEGAAPGAPPFEQAALKVELQIEDAAAANGRNHLMPKGTDVVDICQERPTLLLGQQANQIGCMSGAASLFPRRTHARGRRRLDVANRLHHIGFSRGSAAVGRQIFKGLNTLKTEGLCHGAVMAENVALSTNILGVTSAVLIGPENTLARQVEAIAAPASAVKCDAYYRSPQDIPGNDYVMGASRAQEFNENAHWQGLAADMWCAATLMYFIMSEGKSSPQATPAIYIDPRSPGLHEFAQKLLDKDTEASMFFWPAFAADPSMRMLANDAVVSSIFWTDPQSMEFFEVLASSTQDNDEVVGQINHCEEGLSNMDSIM